MKAIAWTAAICCCLFAWSGAVVALLASVFAVLSMGV